MPAMNKHSDLATTEDAQHTVSYDKIYKKGNEEVDDEEYAPEDMGKAYKVRSISRAAIRRQPPQSRLWPLRNDWKWDHSNYTKELWHFDSARQQ